MGLRWLLAGETGCPGSGLRAPFAERPPRVSPMQSESSFLVTQRKEPACPARSSASKDAETQAQVRPAGCPAPSVGGLKRLARRPPGCVTGVWFHGFFSSQLDTRHNEGR